MGKAAVPYTGKRLVETFDRNRDSYRSSADNETQLRRDFLDPSAGLLSEPWPRVN